ncbi:MAG: PIN domain-containing protein [bacterium]
MIPTLLVDINVVLDVILARAPWAEDSAELLNAVAGGRARGFVAGHTITTVHYITERASGRTTAVTAVADLLDICEVVPVLSADFRRALALGLKDFEDAVQVVAALQVGADYLVSRNEKDFKGAPVLVRAPGEVLPLLRGPAPATPPDPSAAR